MPMLLETVDHVHFFSTVPVDERFLSAILVSCGSRFGCRYLSPYNVHIKTNPRFERMLDSYRGSLEIYEWEFQGEYITFLNALKEAKAHLDILRVALQCVDDRHIDALASISCNWLVWSQWAHLLAG